MSIWKRSGDGRPSSFASDSATRPLLWRGFACWKRPSWPTCFARWNTTMPCRRRSMLSGKRRPERRFIQVFTEEIGLTPKLFSRVKRFQRTIAILRQAMAPDWARLAVDCGYFDQSHLIRDFLMLSGFSPSDYLRRQNYLRQHGVHIKRNHLPLADYGQLFPIPAPFAPP